MHSSSGTYSVLSFKNINTYLRNLGVTKVPTAPTELVDIPEDFFLAIICATHGSATDHGTSAADLADLDYFKVCPAISESLITKLAMRVNVKIPSDPMGRASMWGAAFRLLVESGSAINFNNITDLGALVSFICQLAVKLNYDQCEQLFFGSVLTQLTNDGRSGQTVYWHKQDPGPVPFSADILYYEIACEINESITDKPLHGRATRLASMGHREFVLDILSNVFTDTSNIIPMEPFLKYRSLYTPPMFVSVRAAEGMQTPFWREITIEHKKIMYGLCIATKMGGTKPTTILPEQISEPEPAGIANGANVFEATPNAGQQTKTDSDQTNDNTEASAGVLQHIIWMICNVYLSTCTNI